MKVDEAVLSTDAYRRNPLFRVLEHGERLRTRIGEGGKAASPLLAELATLGMTEYVALPLSAGGPYHNAATLATRQAGGFTARQFAEIEALLRLLALHVERHIAARISENLVTTYLGEEAGQQVLRGSIKRGAGTAIDAVIWVSDLRGFTDLADRLSGRELTELLNAYSACLANAVLDRGGEVLKFIGDGLLAVFPFARFDSDEAAAEAAIAAAEAALASLEYMNSDPTALADVPGWRPLRMGIALHCGEVFFGNIGAPKRLDFTVIGKAVNAASRIEALCKTTRRTLLVSESVARLSGRSFDDLGAFRLRGLDRPLSIFALSGR